MPRRGRRISARSTGFARRPGRRGVTLIEVMIALVILTGALLSMGSFMTSFAHDTTLDTAAALASDLAVARIETMKGSGSYATLEHDYEGTAASPDHPGYTIVTELRRVRSGIDDYTVVTVTVTSPTLERPVKKTTIVSAF